MTRLKVLGIVAASALLIGGIASAAKLKISANVVDLPGVTVQGNASCNLADFETDAETTGQGTVKVMVNEKNGTYRVKIKGTALNEARVKQSFSSNPEVHECILTTLDDVLLDLDIFAEVTIDQSKYRVTAKGKASGTIRGKIAIDVV